MIKNRGPKRTQSQHYEDTSIKGKYVKGEWVQKKENENWIDVGRARRARLEVKGQLFYFDKSSVTE